MKNIQPVLSATFAIVTLAIILQSCTPAAITSTSGTGYDEDLSVHRPEYVALLEETVEVSPTKDSATTIEYIEPTNALDTEMDSVLVRIRKSRENIDYIDGFSIQLYSGNSRDQANMVKVKTYEVVEDLKPRMSYEQPNYKVRIGKYFSRLEANADFVTLKKHFSRAVLVPIKIKISE